MIKLEITEDKKIVLEVKDTNPSEALKHLEYLIFTFYKDIIEQYDMPIEAFIAHISMNVQKMNTVASATKEKE